ncbi:MAG TPA: FecR family protein [bacterium]|nr:FecR family protein [bacterium]
MFLRSILLGILLGLPVRILADTHTDTASRFPAQYILDSIQGKVQVRSKGVTVLEDAKEDQVVLEGDTILTGPDSKVSLVLNTMTMTQIGEKSQVTVGKLVKKGTSGFLSRLKLSFGKILSQVEKLATSHSSFEIEAGGVVCGVRGTAFEVSVEGSQVTDSTFEGSVEMKNGPQSRMVDADHHSEFDGDRKEFLRQRLVTDRERERYQNWKRFRDLAVRRQKEREQALRSFESLDKPERDQLWEGLDQVRARDRFMILRRIMREGNLRDRRRILDESVHSRVDAVGNRERLREKAAEERERNLRKLKKD